MKKTLCLIALVFVSLAVSQEPQPHFLLRMELAPERTVSLAADESESDARDSEEEAAEITLRNNREIRQMQSNLLAKELDVYDAVNVGAAGTLVIRKPGLRAQSSVPSCAGSCRLKPTIAFCDGSDLIRLEMDNPFGTEPLRADVVQFVSILSEAGRRRVSLPIALPEHGEWLVRIIGSKNRLVYGVYRRHMKTIGCLGQIDKLFGAPATTRSWNTILSVLRILRSYEPGK